jgi:ribosomal protein S14
MLKSVEDIGQSMRCHYCDREAAYVAEKDGVRVGLCQRHFRERVEELSESDGLAALREQLDINRME